MQPSVSPHQVVILAVGVCLLVVGQQWAANQSSVNISPAPQTDPQLQPTVQCNCPAPLPTPTPQDYQVRVQVQGRRLSVGRAGISVALQDTSPIKASAAIAALSTLQGGLTRRDLQMTSQAFDLAKDWIRRVEAAGGINPIGSRSFNNPGVNPNHARVDVEVNRGPINLVP